MFCPYYIHNATWKLLADQYFRLKIKRLNQSYVDNLKFHPILKLSDLTPIVLGYWYT